MNPLHVLGVCEARDEGVPLPRRDKLQFFGGVTVTDQPPNRTVVVPSPGVEASAHVLLGENTPPSSVTTDGNGAKHYVYDERAGSWFGRSVAFSTTNIFYMHTELGPGDTISLQGFAPDPMSPLKYLVNTGPDVITAEGRGTGSSPGMLRGAAVKALPAMGIRIFWDHVDKSWRLIQPPEWREQNRNFIRIKGTNIVLGGWPLYIPRPDARGVKPGPTLT